jgi:CRP-like cAMP-binding protein
VVVAARELFGEVGFIDGMPRTAGASASGKTKLYGLPSEAFAKFQQEQPLLAARFVAELMKDLARKFRAEQGLDVKSASTLKPSSATSR